MPNTSFKSCKMLGVDFTEADLSNAIIEECNLSAAIFQNTNLTKADLRLAQNFSIDIRANRVSKAIVLKSNIEGFLKDAGLDFRV